MTCSLLHGSLGDYAWGEGGLDQIVTQLLNQFEGGSSPVDPKLLGNLPMTFVNDEHIETCAQCTTCMEMFKKVGSSSFFADKKLKLVAKSF